MPKVHKNPAAIELADHIRWVAAIWEDRTGFVSRCQHGKKRVVVGHQDYSTNPDIAFQIDTMLYALRHLDCGKKSGYSIVGLHEVEASTADDQQISLIV